MVEKNVKIACYHVEEVLMNNLANCPKSVTDRLIVSENDLIWEIGYQIVFKYLEIVGKLKIIGYRYDYRRYSNAIPLLLFSYHLHSIAIVLLSVALFVGMFVGMCCNLHLSHVKLWNIFSPIFPMLNCSLSFPC